ncbi:MAG: acetylornithine deacetylase [Pseudomonadota bacterium]
MRLSSRELLATLVGFDTTSRSSNLSLIDWVANYLSDLGVHSHYTRNDEGNKANLFATVGPRDVGGVCLHGHSDVVPVDGQPWDSDPFALVERDGLLYGRGTSDMKAWAACALAAFPDFAAAKLRTPIHIALSYDEEVGCFGAARMIASFGKSVPMPRIAIIGEPSMMAPITAHKGCLAMETRITGRDAHSSLLHLGVSAAAAVAEMTVELHRIAREWMRQPGPRGMVPSGPTMNVGQLQAGVARNVIAREGSLAWEVRFRRSDDPDALLREALGKVEARLRASFGDSFGDLAIATRELARVPAFDAGSGGAAELLVRQLGAAGPTEAMPYGAEAGQYADAGIASVICGPGNVEQAHQPNEFIAASQLAECDRLLAQLGRWAVEMQLAAPLR